MQIVQRYAFNEAEEMRDDRKNKHVAMMFEENHETR